MEPQHDAALSTVKPAKLLFSRLSLGRSVASLQVRKVTL
jgi:hypothetical protein